MALELEPELEPVPGLELGLGLGPVLHRHNRLSSVWQLLLPAR
ncbi:hypothetical protein ACFLUE_02295 [Chloroflexota bacterium]